MAQSEAETSVKDGLMSLVVSESGSAVVGMIAGRLVTAIAASSTAAVATSGGATAGGAAAGAAEDRWCQAQARLQASLLA